jgi:hypothetical protein
LRGDASQKWTGEGGDGRLPTHRGEAEIAEISAEDFKEKDARIFQ